MKIILDLDHPLYDSYRVFNTKEEWEKCEYSYHYRRNHWKEGTYQTTALREPLQFPCIGLFMGTIPRSDSYDEENIVWLYDFKEIEDGKED